MLKILIVEDEEPIANLIRMNLAKAGYQCEIAADGEEAANKIEENMYDLKDVAQEVKDRIGIVPVENVSEVLSAAGVRDPE